MKTIKILVTAAALLLGAAAISSCATGDGGEAKNNNRRATVNFTGGISGQAATRAAGTSWSAGDLIGIFMVEKGTTTPSGTVANRQYTTTAGTGTFTPAAPSEAIEFPTDDDAEVDFTAYYPWANGMSLSTPMTVLVNPNQTSANQPEYDLLWGAADNSGEGYTNDYAGTVALGFTHRLSKIVLNVTADPKIGSLAGMVVRAKGINISGSMDLATGIVSAPSAATDITMRTVTDGSAYDAIIVPATYAAAAASLEFIVGTKTYSCDLPAMTYASANEYLYTVTILPGGITITGTIRPWINNNAGNLTAQ
jgi:hypothetical protein